MRKGFGFFVSLLSIFLVLGCAQTQEAAKTKTAKGAAIVLRPVRLPERSLGTSPAIKVRGQ